LSSAISIGRILSIASYEIVVLGATLLAKGFAFFYNLIKRRSFSQTDANSRLLGGFIMIESKEQFHHRARTKIVATIGPASRSPEMVRALIRAGVSVFRLNTAHGSIADRTAVLEDIRKASVELNYPVGVLVDLAGPKIRLGELFEDPTEFKPGDEFTIVRGDKPTSASEITSNYKPLIDELKVGDSIMLADGTVSMQVTAKEPNRVVCQVGQGGLVRSRQGINLPGTNLSVPSMTEDDIANAIWAAEHHADFVSLSFVRSANDVLKLRKLLRERGSTAMVIAKIEKREALNMLEDIVEATDGVMVARGDLGVEIDVAETPVAQKRIVEACRKQQKPVIVATQMLESMHHNRRPTRAEVSDVANALLDGADACMLSGETAIGDYPRETVEMMTRILLSTEQLLKSREPVYSEQSVPDIHPVTAAVVYGSARIAERLNAKLVVCATRTSGTVRIRSKQRDAIPTIGVSDSPAILRRMSLFWGVTPITGAPVHDGPQLRKFIEEWALPRGIVSTGDRIVFVTGTNFYPLAHNLLVIHEVG
jgi:pyruvate kinase